MKKSNITEINSLNNFILFSNYLLFEAEEAEQTGLQLKPKYQPSEVASLDNRKEISYKGPENVSVPLPTPQPSQPMPATAPEQVAPPQAQPQPPTDTLWGHIKQGASDTANAAEKSWGNFVDSDAGKNLGSAIKAPVTTAKNIGNDMLSPEGRTNIMHGIGNNVYSAWNSGTAGKAALLGAGAAGLYGLNKIKNWLFKSKAEKAVEAQRAVQRAQLDARNEEY